MAKTLVVYYSQSRGNTKKIAQEIASTLGADLAAIDTVQPYNCSYDELVYGLSKTETQNKVCPPIKPLDKDPAYYDRILLGTPTWWYTMAPAVRTFLTETDLTGKELVLFATHGGDRQETPMPTVTAWACLPLQPVRRSAPTIPPATLWLPCWRVWVSSP